MSSYRLQIMVTTFELTVIFDRNTDITVQLGNPYRGVVCGLCGNYDGAKDNEYYYPDGREVGTAVKLSFLIFSDFWFNFQDRW